MSLLPDWVPHTVKVQPFLGEGANGPVWGPETTLGNVYVRDIHEVTVDASGAEIISSGRVYFNLPDTPAVGSRVRVWVGTQFERVATVVKVSRAEHPYWPGLGTAYLN